MHEFYGTNQDPVQQGAGLLLEFSKHVSAISVNSTPRLINNLRIVFTSWISGTLCKNYGFVLISMLP